MYNLYGIYKHFHQINADPECDYRIFFRNEITGLEFQCGVVYRILYVIDAEVRETAGIESETKEEEGHEENKRIS